MKEWSVYASSVKIDHNVEHLESNFNNKIIKQNGSSTAA